MPNHSEPLVLSYPGDYRTRLESVEKAALRAAKDKTPLTALETHPYEELRQEFNALRAEAEAAADEAGLLVVFDSLGRGLMRKLKARHPARDGESADRLFNANMESIQDDLVHAMLVKPEKATCARDQRIATEPCGEDNPCSRRAAFAEWAEWLGYGEWNLTAVSATEHLIAVSGDPKELPPLPTQSDG